jgi:hypothetical protein
MNGMLLHLLFFAHRRLLKKKIYSQSSLDTLSMYIHFTWQQKFCKRTEAVNGKSPTI